ncbi:CIA30 family protein [Salinimicrobium sp. HB62]|uniref:CIA30 family protein n=1 Tax=Salinimicrobium sp. HB62 TaxID=3077781 RepID=UPI002D782E3D|nr:CIA30 family protein [Salinimicrobium sp. HB62]
MFQSQYFLLIIALVMNNMILFDFSENDDWSAWDIENDVVMGGRSSSQLLRSEEGNAIFKGEVSLENNGGFASVQYRFPSKDITGYETAVLHLKGDGKKYQFRLKEDLRDRASYIYEFETTGDWQTVEIPLNKMKPVFRGRDVDMPNFSANSIQEVRFLIGNKKRQEFRLEIDKIILQ